MDRVAGWYKRRTQGITLTLGLLIAIAINADTLFIARALSNDASLRKGLVAAAEARANKPLSTDPSASGKDIEQYLTNLKLLGLPIGWQDRPDALPDPPWVPAWAKPAMVQHWLGWALTALAVSLGAPFWFDMLNKFIVIRSTVKPHEKSQEEGSKDTKADKS